MECPVCGAKMSGLLWFDGSRAFFQCLENPNHLLLHVETLKTLPEKVTIVIDREERIREANVSMVFIDSKEAKRIAAMGSRVASPAVMDIMSNITKKVIAILSDKYTESIVIVLLEIKYKKNLKGG